MHDGLREVDRGFDRVAGIRQERVAHDSHVAVTPRALERAVVEDDASDVLSRMRIDRRGGIGVDDDNTASIRFRAIDEAKLRAPLPKLSNHLGRAGVDADRLRHRQTESLQPIKSSSVAAVAVRPITKDRGRKISRTR